MWESPCSALVFGDGTAGCGQKVRLFSRLLRKLSGFRQADGTETENPVILPARRKGRNSAHRREKNRFSWLFPAKQFTGQPLQNLRLFRLKILLQFQWPNAGPSRRPVWRDACPRGTDYDTLIPDFRESRENSERPFLCRRVSLAFPCEIISNHDSVNYD